MFDLCALGELIVDCTPVVATGTVVPMFACKPGGAPGNVAACVSKLGKAAAYIGMVGEDPFGELLIQSLRDVGVDTSGISTTNYCNTTLAFVHLNASGDRSFSFYRKPGADIMLDKADVDLTILDNARIFHFGSVSLTESPAREATLYAAQRASESGKLVTYDPNLRRNLWVDMREAKEYIKRGLLYADIAKLSEEELEFLTDKENLPTASRMLLEQYNLKAVLATLGPRGALCVTPHYRFYSPAFDVRTLDTNGAGDAFTGGFLYRFLDLKKEVDQLSMEEWEDCVRYANAAGSLTTTGSGAIPAIPSLTQIERCIEETPPIQQ